MADPSSDGQAARRLLSAALPCGADVDPLLEQVADGHAAALDAHQRECVHCRAAITEFTVLWRPVTELAASPVAAPPGLAAAVMNQIRVLARDVWYTLQTTDLGVIRIAARIVAAVVPMLLTRLNTHALARILIKRLRFCSVDPHRHH